MNINQTSTASIVKINGVQFASIIKINNVTLASPIPAGTVLSDLLMYLDAGVGSSYPGTGTNWNDLTVNNNDGTLTNGPTYTSANSGGIIFDGTNDYVDVSSAALGTTGGTVCFWIKGLTETDLYSTHSGSWNQNSLYASSGSLLLRISDGTPAITDVSINSSLVFDSQFHYICATWTSSGDRSIWVDCVNLASIPSTLTYTAGSTFEIGYKSWSPNYYNGTIFVASSYSRALSPTEILQNYNTLIGRYLQIPTGTVISGLITYLDAAVSASYPGTGTTWSDLTGNGNNATLTNGPTYIPPYNILDSGNISFDGTNDYANLGTSIDFSNYTSGFTFGFWIRILDTSITNRYLFSKLTTSGTDNQFSVVYGYVSQTLQIYSGTCSETLITGSNIVINDNGWHYVCYTVGTTTTGYLDGNHIAFTNTYGSAPTFTSSSGSNLISSFDGSQYFGNLAIGALFIYNRILSSSEVVRNFNTLINRYRLTTSDVIMYLDASISSSYPGTGTTWTDLTVNNNDGTLINGPTYTSANGGAIIFDGVDDYIDCGTDTSLQFDTGTVSCWVKTSSPGSSYRGIIVKQYGWGLFALNGIYGAYDWGSGVFRSTGIDISNNEWTHVAMSFTSIAGTPTNNASIYINGVLALVATVQKTSPVTTVVLGAGSPSGAQEINGIIGHASIYNRVLSSNEILQNFSDLCDRFLPTPANSFDAGTITSYPGAGTTWYNINGTQNATLYNGITYSADGGGSLVFDGSNDYAAIPYDSSFDFSTGNYTISSWVKFTSGPSTATITAKDTNGANFDWCIYFPDASNISNYSNGTSTNVTATLGSPVSTGTWYLVTISSISGVNSIYLNGLQYGTSTYMSTSNSNTTALTIGSVSWNSPSLFLAGKIAIMEYYTVGLTSAEVLLNFNKNKKRFGY